MATKFSCFNSDRNGQCEYLLNDLKKPSGVEKRFIEKIDNIVMQFQIAGQHSKMKLCDANDKFINQHYPEIERRNYCWPIVYTMSHPEKATRTNPTKMKGSDRDRLGDVAEDEVRRMFITMFRNKAIPCFVISNYEWYQMCLKEVNSTIATLLELFTAEGESDLLIVIPNECIIIVEVKARKNPSRDFIKSLLNGCQKGIDFLSTMLADVSTGVYIPVIRVAALPFAYRSTVSPMSCDNCFRNIVTKEDLQDLETFYEWFEQLKSKYSSDIERSQLSATLCKKLIGRLVGSCSIRLFEDIPDAVQGTVSSINEVCYQLNPKQVHAHRLLHKKLMWIRGVPGSGKTVLGFAKAGKIIESALQAEQTTEGTHINHVLYIINGSSPPNDSSCLMQLYEAKFGAGNDRCKVCVKESHQIKNYSSNLSIPQLIQILQMKHKDERVHIILEECQMKLIDMEGDDLKEKWKNLVKEDGLGNVWIIQSSFAAKEDSVENPLPGFKIADLDKVMRMSLENIKLFNILTESTYSPGHAVTGKLPVIFRMSCICTEDRNRYHCLECYHIRLVWMLRTAIKRLNFDTSLDVCVRNAFITSDFTQNELREYLKCYDSAYSIPPLNRLPDNGFPALFFASSINHFTGCERSHVFVEFDCVVQDDFSAMESLTRAVGQMVLLDAGHVRREHFEEYNQMREKVDRAVKAGYIEITDMSECHIKAAKEAFLRRHLLKTINFGEETDGDLSLLRGATGSSAHGQDEYDMQMNERPQNSKNWEKIDEDHRENISNTPALRIARLEQEISKLKKRVATLERETLEQDITEGINAAHGE